MSQQVIPSSPGAMQFTPQRVVGAVRRAINAYNSPQGQAIRYVGGRAVDVVNSARKRYREYKTRKQQRARGTAKQSSDSSSKFRKVYDKKPKSSKKKIAPGIKDRVRKLEKSLKPLKPRYAIGIFPYIESGRWTGEQSRWMNVQKTFMPPAMLETLKKVVPKNIDDSSLDVSSLRLINESTPAHRDIHFKFQLETSIRNNDLQTCEVAMYMLKPKQQYKSGSYQWSTLYDSILYNQNFYTGTTFASTGSSVTEYAASEDPRLNYSDAAPHINSIFKVLDHKSFVIKTGEDFKYYYNTDWIKYDEILNDLDDSNAALINKHSLILLVRIKGGLGNSGGVTGYVANVLDYVHKYRVSVKVPAVVSKKTITVLDSTSDLGATYANIGWTSGYPTTAPVQATDDKSLES